MSETERFDVIVVGGGSAGVAAAVGAARTGARTLLVEAYGFLGGAATRSSVLAWCGFFPQRPGSGGGRPPARLVGGVGAMALAELEAMGVDVAPYHSATGNWNIRLDPEATKVALDRLAEGPGLELLLHTSVVDVTTRGRRIEALRLADPRGLREVTARAFVDCSGEAVLAFAAGASPCPLHAPSGPIQPASFPVRLGGVAPRPAFDRAARTAAMATIDRRLGVAELRADGGFVSILPGTDDIWWLAVEVETNGLDGADLTRAECDGRAAVRRGVEALRRVAPGFERATIVATGPAIGIRESRHAATREPLRETALAAGMRRADEVALGGWPMEIHGGPGKVEYRQIGADGAYGIPLGALRSADFDDLWFGGRTVGADPAAYASARVMGTAFATGHASGVAAALSDDVTAVRAELARQGAVF
ncbi:FAD-dependent oxidoreductase [Pinisolibacter sp.]|uniref:FAD-dependent oxidoreductase n=1 Tax=Pinisolibacter sp. TaxID=2172024 RepID=UPI002FDDDA1C